MSFSRDQIDFFLLELLKAQTDFFILEIDLLLSV